MDEHIISIAYEWKRELAVEDISTAKDRIAFFQNECPESERLAVLAGAVNAARLYPMHKQFMIDANRLIGEFIDELVLLKLKKNDPIKQGNLKNAS